MKLQDPIEIINPYSEPPTFLSSVTINIFHPSSSDDLPKVHSTATLIVTPTVLFPPGAFISSDPATASTRSSSWFPFSFGLERTIIKPNPLPSRLPVTTTHNASLRLLDGRGNLLYSHATLPDFFRLPGLFFEVGGSSWSIDEKITPRRGESVFPRDSRLGLDIFSTHILSSRFPGATSKTYDIDLVKKIYENVALSTFHQDHVGLVTLPFISPSFILRDYSKLPIFGSKSMISTSWSTAGDLYPGIVAQQTPEMESSLNLFYWKGNEVMVPLLPHPRSLSSFLSHFVGAGVDSVGLSLDSASGRPEWDGTNPSVALPISCLTPQCKKLAEATHPGAFRVATSSFTTTVEAFIAFPPHIYACVDATKNGVVVPPLGFGTVRNAGKIVSHTLKYYPFLDMIEIRLKSSVQAGGGCEWEATSTCLGVQIRMVIPSSVAGRPKGESEDVAPSPQPSTSIFENHCIPVYTRGGVYSVDVNSTLIHFFTPTKGRFIVAGVYAWS